MAMPHGQQRVKGFTLIEVMLALLIFAIMATIAFSGLISTLTARNATDFYSEELAKLQLGMSIITRDVEQAINRPIIDNFGEERFGLESLFGSEFALEFTRAGWRNPLWWENRSTLQRVAYRLSNGNVERISWRVLDQARDSQASIRVLFTGVAGLQLQFMDISGNFYNEWPPLNVDPVFAKLFPLAVVMVIEFEEQGDLRRVFRLPEG